MRRGDQDLKDLVHRLLADAGREVRTVVLEAGEDGQAHADEHTVEQVFRELQPGLSVVSVGSGTVTDVAKHAVFLHDELHDRLPLVFIATANTMVAYTARMAVIAKHGVKRTHKSRLADTLIMDTTILRDAPPESGLAGIGDAAAMYVSFGDWWLGKRFGLGNYLQASSDLVGDVRTHLLPYASSMGERSPVGLEVQSRLMVLCGLSATIAGESAPLSGYEHVISHMLDMSAAHYGRPVGTHGAQVGMAVLPCSIAFNLLIDELDPANVDIDACYPDPRRDAGQGAGHVRAARPDRGDGRGVLERLRQEAVRLARGPGRAGVVPGQLAGRAGPAARAGASDRGVRGGPGDRGSAVALRGAADPDPGGAGPLGVRQRPPDAQPVLQRGPAALPRLVRRGLRGPGLHPHAPADRPGEVARLTGRQASKQALVAIPAAGLHPRCLGRRGGRWPRAHAADGSAMTDKESSYELLAPAASTACWVFPSTGGTDAASKPLSTTTSTTTGMSRPPPRDHNADGLAPLLWALAAASGRTSRCGETRCLKRRAIGRWPATGTRWEEEVLPPQPTTKSIIIGEVVGCFLLSLFGLGIGVSATLWGAPGSPWFGDIWPTAWGWAMAIALGIYVTATLSGAHFNPAVTITMAVTGRHPGGSCRCTSCARSSAGSWGPPF